MPFLFTLQLENEQERGGGMPRAPSEKVKEAEKLFRKGMKLVEIASQLNLPPGTVRRWKSTYEWDSERSDKKSERSNKRLNKKRTKVADEVKGVMDNAELTDKQRLFCIYYIRCFNATKSYQKAYACSYNNAMVEGSKLLRNPKVKKEIMRLKQDKLNREFFSEEDVFQKYMDIAFADITDYVEFGNEQMEVILDNGETKEITVSHVNIRNSNEVDGTLISEVSKGKDGVKVKLADRMAALKWLSEHMDLATEEQKVRMAVMKENAKTQKDDDVVNDWISSVIGEDVSDDE